MMQYLLKALRAFLNISGSPLDSVCTSSDTNLIPATDDPSRKLSPKAPQKSSLLLIPSPKVTGRHYGRRRRGRSDLTVGNKTRVRSESRASDGRVTQINSCLFLELALLTRASSNRVVVHDDGYSNSRVSSCLFFNKTLRWVCDRQCSWVILVVFLVSLMKIEWSLPVNVSIVTNFEWNTLSVHNSV